MSTGSRVLAVIPARGGSKGLPRKNILEAGGRPLIAWTIDAALAASCVDRVVLSTDDEEIAAVAKGFGCDVPFMRPPELADDEAPTIDVVMHALRSIPQHDVVILLQPTSPLRTAADIDAAFSLMKKRQAPSCVSVCPVEETPYWMYRIDAGDHLLSLMEPTLRANRRQDLPEVFSLNGAIYIADTAWLLGTQSFVTPETVAYVMPRERSIDIDSSEDLDSFKNALLKESHGSVSKPPRY